MPVKRRRWDMRTLNPALILFRRDLGKVGTRTPERRFNGSAPLVVKRNLPTPQENHTDKKCEGIRDCISLPVDRLVSYRCAITLVTLVCGRHASEAQSGRAGRGERALPPALHAWKRIGIRSLPDPFWSHTAHPRSETIMACHPML